MEQHAVGGYCNVNEHIYITAIEYDPDDADHLEIKRYDQLAPLSGGERQEFVAFMSAAALRYRLGDTHHQRPRFAPVVLDEAFIKSQRRLRPSRCRRMDRAGFSAGDRRPAGQSDRC